MWRQGDILMMPIRELPADARLRPDLVLAEGERTGHRHRIAETGGALLFERGTDLFLGVKAESVTVVHDEHKPIVLNQGRYRVWRQREYSPMEDRFVED